MTCRTAINQRTISGPDDFFDDREELREEVARLRPALERCQKILAILLDPDSNKPSGVSTQVAWAQCVEAELAARKALEKP